MIRFEKKPKSRPWTGNPFPIGIQAVGYFTGVDVEIFDPEICKKFHDNGSFGLNPKPRQFLKFQQQQELKPISDSEYQRKIEWKEKFGCDDEENEKILLEDGNFVVDPFKIHNSLVLFLEEAFFLQNYLKCLEIRDVNETPISTENLWTQFCKIKQNFVECFVTFLYLKSKNWVIKSGLKYGGDFLLYKHSPARYHATFIVVVQKSDEKSKSTLEFHTNERIAEITAKNMLYFEVVFPHDLKPEEYVWNLDKFQVSEMMIKRHEFN